MSGYNTSLQNKESGYDYFTIYNDGKEAGTLKKRITVDSGEKYLILFYKSLDSIRILTSLREELLDEINRMLKEACYPELHSWRKHLDEPQLIAVMLITKIGEFWPLILENDKEIFIEKLKSHASNLSTNREYLTRMLDICEKNSTKTPKGGIKKCMNKFIRTGGMDKLLDQLIDTSEKLERREIKCKTDPIPDHTEAPSFQPQPV